MSNICTNCSREYPKELLHIIYEDNLVRKAMHSATSGVFFAAKNQPTTRCICRKCYRHYIEMEIIKNVI